MSSQWVAFQKALEISDETKRKMLVLGHRHDGGPWCYHLWVASGMIARAVRSMRPEDRR